VNRQARALLAVLILAALAVPYWFFTRAQREPENVPGGIHRTVAAEGPKEPPVRGGAIVATTRTDPRSFNRLTHPEIATELFALLTQGRLVRINRATQEVEPWLAEKWAVSPDGRTYTLSLRRGVTWSDGTAFTAADVLFSIQALYDPRVASPLVAAMMIGGRPITAVATDAQTVVVTYPEPFGPGIRLLDLMPIMPKHRLETALAAGTFATAWTPKTPPADLVSIGPFRLTDYQPAQRLVFDRNPGYWRRDERGVQLPYVDRLTIEIFPDQDAEIVRLQSGHSDFMQQALRSSDIETLQPLAAQGRVQIVELGVSLDADSFVFNLRPEKWATDSRASWMTRREFRQALSHAVDREAFANTVFLGAAVPVHGPVTPGNTRWFWPSIPRYEFSRDQARALLTGLGLANRDQDEWLEDDGGREVRMTALTFRGNTALERGAEVLRDDLRQIGVALDVVALEPNTVRQRVITGDFETAFIQFQASDPDPAMSKDLWVSSGGAHFWNPAQTAPATEWEREIDQLMARQASALDESERKRLFNEVQRLFAENLPILYFAAPRVYIGASARLTNLQPALTRPPLLWSADTLGVKAATP
jgi:peptide/nickel transport system substrate-binding protein